MAELSALRQTPSYQFAADAPALVAWQHGERSERDDVVLFNGDKRCDQGIGWTKSFDKSCLAILAERHLEDVADRDDILRNFCADCDHQSDRGLLTSKVILL